MSSSEDEYNPGAGGGSSSGKGGDDGGPPPKKSSGNKRLSVERIYQKKSQLEHILLRPDSYVGTLQHVTEPMFVFDKDQDKIVQREITHVPGLYKIFDEIVVNAADNKQRDPKMDTIKIDIKPDTNEIKVYNNGRGIPVVHHKDEDMYVPTMIFGHLLTSSNFNDDEEKVTGGRNGYGAKLCNVFSTKFVLETATKEYGKEFKQIWGNNMTKASDPKIKPFKGEDFTRVTFYPDLARFKLDKLTDDMVALLSRRAYDVAASTKGVKVYLNGKLIKIKGFEDYVKFMLRDVKDDNGQPVKHTYSQCGERWEIAVAVSDKGFQQMSFVNSIATTKGGRHVEYISDMITKALIDIINKKNKGGMTIKPFQIKSHIYVFVNCLITNPTFDSQTKENMTSMVKNFGSKCSLNEKFLTQVSKSGIVEAVLAYAKFKQDQVMKKSTGGKKSSKLKNMPKLEDANEAGTKNSMDCTLILTEGDSAKTLAVSGLSVVGRDKYGVFPLRGKLLNVREATYNQVTANKEISDLCKIMGLAYKKKYDTDEALKTLRYGKMMIMTDQDQDGSHIKGLIINFVHHNWPELLKRNFLEEFITPIVKVTKGNNVQSFYSLPEFNEWKEATDNWTSYKIKYYKGLGTSTSKEAKEYFQDMKRHRILFEHGGNQDDYSITMAFAKKATEERKTWLTNWMDEGKRRKELGLSEVYLYEKNTKSITYTDFVNKELVLFSNLDNTRSIPSLVDGFKPGQRKVMFTCFKRNDKREVKVAQLAGSVGEMSAYHHGEASLMGTIINLAQNYVGSNNINLLQPIGQFGTRLAGGKDHASPRYIFTKMSPITRNIFNPQDDNVLTYLKDDNLTVEPEYYVPILPLVLVNGADGIGTGWMTRIPNYNPRDIVKNLKRMLNDEEPHDMIPWFKGFTGTIDSLGDGRYAINGEISSLSDTKIEITELPIRTWTQTYKESTMEVLLNGTEKTPGNQITDYKEYHTDLTVKFLVTMAADKLREAETKKGLHQFFKLQTTLSTSSMVLFDQNGCIRTFDSPESILKEFYPLRLKYYDMRKKFLVGQMEAEALKLTNQARFILEKCDGRLKVENKKKKVMIAELEKSGYDADPIKRWLASRKAQEENPDEEEGSDDEESNKDKAASDYDYLLGMPIWNLTLEKKNEIIKKKDDKLVELNKIKSTSIEDMWRFDLDEFINKLEEIEEKEREELIKVNNNSKGKDKGSKKKNFKTEMFAPSPQGIRVAPRIDDELRAKVAKAVAAKKNAGTKKSKMKAEVKEEAAEKDEFDDMISNNDLNRSLSERIGIDKKEKKEKLAKSSPKKKGGGKRKNPWESDVSDDGDNSDMSENDDADTSFERRAPSKRATKANKKIIESGSDAESDSDMELFDNNAVKESNGNNGSHKIDKMSDDESEDEFDAMLNSSKKSTTSNGNNESNGSAQKRSILDNNSGSDSDVPLKKAPKKAEKKEKKEKKVPKAPPPAKKTAPKKKKPSYVDSGSDEDMFGNDQESDDDFVVESKPKPPSRGKAKKATYIEDSDSDY